MRDIMETVISQYEHSPRLLALIRAFDERIDPATDVESFYRLAFDPDSAEGWGLDVWGRIVAIPRKMQVKGDDGTFGFVGSGLQPFNQGTFHEPRVSDTYLLADPAYRLVIFCKAAANITDGSLRDLNAIMARLLPGRGALAVIHTGTMVIRHVVQFPLKSWERSLMLMDGVAPVPAGVELEILEAPTPAFGFAGSGLHPFNQGTFAQGVYHASTE